MLEQLADLIEPEIKRSPLLRMFPDLLEKPIDWQIAILGIYGLSRKDMTLVKMCNDLMKGLRAIDRVALCAKCPLSEQGIMPNGCFLPMMYFDTGTDNSL